MAHNSDRPKDLKTAWIAPAQPQWESLLLGVAHDKSPFLLVGRYNKDIKKKEWTRIGLAPASLQQLAKEAQASLKLVQGA